MPNDKKKITREDVLKLGHLAALQISDSDADAVAAKLDSILGYVSRLDAVNVEGVEPMSHVHGSTNVFREDVLEPSMDVKELLAITPASSGRYIKVPIVIDDE